MLVMGKAGHRLQQGRPTNPYIAYQQYQHQQHLVAQQLVPYIAAVIMT